jgi:hypothetical protein
MGGRERILSNREVRQMVTREGGSVVPGGSHLKIRDANGRLVGILPKNGKLQGYRAYLNMRSQLQNAGLWNP